MLAFKPILPINFTYFAHVNSPKQNPSKNFSLPMQGGFLLKYFYGINSRKFLLTSMYFILSISRA